MLATARGAAWIDVHVRGRELDLCHPNYIFGGESTKLGGKVDSEKIIVTAHVVYSEGSHTVGQDEMFNGTEPVKGKVKVASFIDSFAQKGSLMDVA